MLTLLGRMKDVVVTHGRKHSLADIDALLSATPGIAGPAHACAVPGAGDEVEALAVVLVPPVSADADARGAMAGTVHRVLARRFALAPAAIHAADAEDLPLTGAGKIRRIALGESVREGRFGPPLRGPVAAPASVPQAVDNALAAVWREVFGLTGPLDPQGTSSNSAAIPCVLTLATRIEAAFGRWISADAFFAEPTLTRLTETINGLFTAEAVLRGGRVRHLRMGLLVQYSPATRTDRQSASRRGRRATVLGLRCEPRCPDTSQMASGKPCTVRSRISHFHPLQPARGHRARPRENPRPTPAQPRAHADCAAGFQLVG